MPHPTPYSRQFDAIRSTYPALFERPDAEALSRAPAGNTDAADSRSGCESKPESK